MLVELFVSNPLLRRASASTKEERKEHETNSPFLSHQVNPLSGVHETGLGHVDQRMLLS